MNRPLTGKRVLGIFVGGFGIIIAVNLVMATYATRTFPGLVVENSYIAGQQYNAGLEAGRAQKALGWNIVATSSGGRVQAKLLDAKHHALQGARIDLALAHPIGRNGDPVDLVMSREPDGEFRSTHTLSPGRWDIELAISRGGDQHWSRTEVRVE